MGGASSKNVPTFVRNYEELVARNALPEATKLFDELAPTFMAQPPPQKQEAWDAWNQPINAIVQLLKNIRPVDVLLLKKQYATKAERVDAHKIRDSFVVFVAYLEIPRVEITVETTVDQFTLTRALTQLFTLRGTLKSVKIISNATHEFRINKAINTSLETRPIDRVKGTPFFTILKEATPGALAEASLKDWIPSAEVAEGAVITWDVVLTQKKEPEAAVPPPAIENIVEIVYDVETEADNLNKMIIASIEFFAVNRVFSMFPVIRTPIVERWWQKHVEFVRTSGTNNNDSLRKWAKDVNEQIARRGGRAFVFAEIPFPQAGEPYRFSYQKDLGDGRTQYIGVLTLKKEIRSVITWDIDNRLSKLVDKFHAALKFAISKLGLKIFLPMFPLFGNVIHEWQKKYFASPSALATELTEFCRTYPSNAPLFEWNMPARAVISVQYNLEENNKAKRENSKTSVLRIMVNGEHWGSLYISYDEDPRIFIDCEEPFYQARTHEIAALVMKYDIEHAADKIPFFPETQLDWSLDSATIAAEINEECAMNGSVARIEMTDRGEAIYDYYHGTTLVGELSFDEEDRILWKNRPANWETLKTTWQRV
jgi:hypothetical protein